MIRNKLIYITTIMLATFSLFVGCSKTSVKNTSQNTPIINNTEIKESNTKEKLPPVLIENIELLDFNIKPPNSISTIYMEGKFKNNSDKNITHIQYTYKFDGEKHYLTTYDTLLPGDTSSIVETFAPISGNPEDMELLQIKITSLDENNKEVYIYYDTKLKTYSFH